MNISVNRLSFSKVDYKILPPEELIEEGIVRLPISKSVLNRRLLLTSLTPGGVLSAPKGEECVDIIVMRSALDALASTKSSDVVEINVGESATALRFLTAVCASRTKCETVITGLPGLLRRPVGELVDVLRRCGAKIQYIGEKGFAPLSIVGCKLEGGEVNIDATISSQFISALMMVAPLMSKGLKINFDGEPASLPYIKMTAEMMRRRGADVTLYPTGVTIAEGGYTLVEDDDEADWSAAAFWYEVVALTAGWVTLRGESAPMRDPSSSLQGDSAAASFFERLGVLTGEPEDEDGNPTGEEGIALSPYPEIFGRLDLDLNDNPDLAPALTVTCCMLGVPFHFVGLKALSIKETDRLQALVEEMDKVGCCVEKIRDFGLEWDGKRHPLTEIPVLDSRGDHRLAMAFAPIAAYVPGIVVKNAGCVSKSYPAYWQSLRSLGFQTLDPSAEVEKEEGNE